MAHTYKVNDPVDVFVDGGWQDGWVMVNAQNPERELICKRPNTADRAVVGPTWLLPNEVRPTTAGRTASREEVYAAINTEREYQDALWSENVGTPANPNPLSIGEYVLMIEEYAARARAEWTAEKRPEMKTLNVIRKIAGIAVRCMEHHGAPERK